MIPTGNNCNSAWCYARVRWKKITAQSPFIWALLKTTQSNCTTFLQTEHLQCKNGNPRFKLLQAGVGGFWALRNRALCTIASWHEREPGMEWDTNDSCESPLGSFHTLVVFHHPSLPPRLPTTRIVGRWSRIRRDWKRRGRSQSFTRPCMTHCQRSRVTCREGTHLEGGNW